MTDATADAATPAATPGMTPDGAPRPDQPYPPVAGDAEAGPAAPAGWYPDPSGTVQARYWTGYVWTDSTGPADKYAPRARSRWWRLRPLGDEPNNSAFNVAWVALGVLWGLMALAAPPDESWSSILVALLWGSLGTIFGLQTLLRRRGQPALRWAGIAMLACAVATFALALVAFLRH